jgi:sugar/nucleoside kinase (ribokinase family)
VIEKADILCVGNAIVDVYASFRGPGPFPKETKHVGNEEMAALLASLDDPVYTAGGGAANAAKIAGLLGFSTGFAGTVGAGPSGKGDDLAGLFEAELRSAGVTPFLSLGKNSTGSCVILREAGSRDSREQSSGITACPGAALELRPDNIPDSLIREARVLLLDGYILPRLELSESLMNRARKSGVPVALDSGAPFVVRSLGKKILDYLRELPLLLFMNEEEEQAFTEVTGAAPKELTGQGPFPVVVVKQGKRGAVVFSGGSIIRTKTRARIPLESTGAGDAFCGAFLCAWIRKRPLAECAALANEAAGLVLDAPGTSLNDPLRKAFAALGEALRDPS